MGVREVSVRCCIAGGGPAGMMLALLLARAGIAVLVLDKRGDFLRDFRGDTIHPSTLEVMHELGVSRNSCSDPIRKSGRSARRSATPFCRSPILRICRPVASSSP